MKGDKAMIKKAFRVFLTLVVTMIAFLLVYYIGDLKSKGYSDDVEFFTYVHYQTQPGIIIHEENLVWYPQESELQNLLVIQKENTKKKLKYVVVPGFPINDWYDVVKDGIVSSRVRPVKEREHEKVTRLLRNRGYEGTILFW